MSGGVKMNIRKFSALILTLCLLLTAVPLIAQADYKAMKSSEPLIQFIKQCEGFESKKYSDFGHYSIGYNFIVKGDSIILISQQPEEHVSQLETDSFSIRHNRHLAVTDINILPQDSIDSVWVQVVSDQGRLGWIHERQLLNNVVPTDPISQFIMFFSSTHVVLAVILVVMMSVFYIMRLVTQRNAPLVHLRDIDSFYPSLLCIIVACSATFYASLQMFGADTWQHFYYHPSVNPFIMPPILGIFISSIWAMLIVGIATIDDVRHKLPLEDIILYRLPSADSLLLLRHNKIFQAK